MSIAELLKQTSDLHEINSKAKSRYADRFAPDFNYCDFVDFDELKISQILAWLLHPKASHGQGATFLKLLLNRLELHWPEENLGMAEIIVEAPAYAEERRRRIDILIRGGERLIGIENKLWGAADQIGQVRDYLAYLNDKAAKDDNRCLIYLTQTRTSPVEHSVTKQQSEQEIAAKRLRLWGFRPDLVDWLHDCKSSSKAARIAYFIEEISAKLSQAIEGISDMTETNQIVETIIKSPENIRAAFDIANAAERTREALIVKLLAALDQGCTERGWKLMSDLTPDKKETGISVDFGPSYPGLFRLQFEAPKYKYLIFGIVARELNHQPDETIQRRISASSLGSTEPSGGVWWHWFRRAGSNDTVLPIDLYWNTSPEPWMAIAGGGLHLMIMAAAQRFKDVLDGRPEA